MTVVTESLLHSKLATEFDIRHVDTSDHRPIAAVGRFDFRNVWLAFRHAVLCLRVVLTHRPDLLYIPIARNRAGFLRDALLLLPARPFTGQVVAHFHSRDFTEFYDGESRWTQRLIRWCLSGTHVVVLGESRRQDFGSLVPAERVHVVANGVSDVGPGTPAGDRASTVLHIATLGVDKGTLDLLRAAVKVQESGLKAQYVLSGEWLREEDRQAAELLIETHGLAVEITGVVEADEKQRLLRNAAVMGFPTRYPFESQPLVILEAFSSGTPVISTRIGAIPETLRDGIDGTLVDSDDTDELAAALMTILSDRDLRSRMGASARERYEDRYTLDAFVSRLAEVWRSCLGRSAEPAGERDHRVIEAEEAA
jgi:glycosyltransferase involved in cell wall biosynthesis